MKTELDPITLISLALWLDATKPENPHHAFNRISAFLDSRDDAEHLLSLGWPTIYALAFERPAYAHVISRHETDRLSVH